MWKEGLPSFEVNRDVERKVDDTMREHVGLVLNTFKDRRAEVATDRRNFCSGCQDTRNCRACLTGARRVVTVQNSAGARQGDVVSLCFEDSGLWTRVLWLSIIPVLWLMAGAMIGSGLGGDWEIGETGGAILLGLSGFAIGFAMIAIVSNSLKLVLKIPPRIIRVIESPSEGARSPCVLQQKLEQYQFATGPQSSL